MSVTIILFIVGLIISVLRKAASGQKPSEQPEHRPVPRNPTVESQAPAQTSTGAQQSAWEWMNGTSEQPSGERDPEGETQMYRDVPEEWIHPVESSLKVDLTEMRESQHEIVHETVRESVHVRRDRSATPAPAAQKPKSKIALNSSNLAQALILSEVLGEPRSKRPWNPRGKR
ncbi:MAG: hypothetical protein ACXVOI_03635 [Tumebacillaceae bacterium]